MLHVVFRALSLSLQSRFQLLFLIAQKSLSPTVSAVAGVMVLHTCKHQPAEGLESNSCGSGACTEAIRLQWQQHWKGHPQLNHHLYHCCYCGHCLDPGASSSRMGSMWLAPVALYKDTCRGFAGPIYQGI